MDIHFIVTVLLTIFASTVLLLLMRMRDVMKAILLAFKHFRMFENADAYRDSIKFQSDSKNVRLQIERFNTSCIISSMSGLLYLMVNLLAKVI